MSEARIGQRRGSGTRVGREADCKDGPKCGGDPIGRSRDVGILENGAEASLKAMSSSQAGPAPVKPGDGADGTWRRLGSVAQMGQ